MALVTCRECKGQISSEAKACPHCGYRDTRSSKGGFLFALIILSIAAGVFGSIPLGLGFFASFAVIGILYFALRR